MQILHKGRHDLIQERDPLAGIAEIVAMPIEMGKAADPTNLKWDGLVSHNKTTGWVRLIS